MKIQREFSQNAEAYDEVNVIQKRVAKRLLSKITDAPARMLDIGCGNGTIFKQIGWRLEYFVGMDFADGMLALHPRKSYVTLLRRDFNDIQAFEEIKGCRFDRIVSASALQWAKDLDMTLASIAALRLPASLAIFTSGTFRTLHETAGLAPILRDREEVVSLLQKHFDADIETVRYTLAFSSVREMFRYMKKSGVGAGRNMLDYRQMRHLMQSYPLDHLEYEIVFLHQHRADN